MVSSVLDPSTRNNIKRHYHPRVLPFAEIESQNICFAKNKRKNRNRMLLLGLQATVNKCNLLVPKERASHAGLLTQGCSSWAEDAILINHSIEEKPLLLLSTFPALTSSSFPLHYVTDNSETQVWSKEALLWYISLALPTKPLHVTPHLFPISNPSGPLSAPSPLVLYWYSDTWSGAGISTCNSAPNLNPSVLSGTPRAIFRIPNKYINCFQFISLKSFCLITIHLEFVFLMVYGYCW